MEPTLPLVNARCCGIDVHKDTVVVCVRTAAPGGRAANDVRTFGTTTGASGAGRLAGGVRRDGRGHGVDRRLLRSRSGSEPEGRATADGEPIDLMLVNARHVKNVPGRKTDVKDCQWLAQLLAAGLLSPSFVPGRPLRELRDLTRQRAQLIGDKTRFANRLQPLRLRSG